jgi:hypothetical protein
VGFLEEGNEGRGSMSRKDTVNLASSKSYCEQSQQWEAISMNCGVTMNGVDVVKLFRALDMHKAATL